MDLSSLTDEEVGRLLILAVLMACGLALIGYSFPLPGSILSMAVALYGLATIVGSDRRLSGVLIILWATTGAYGVHLGTENRATAQREERARRQQIADEQARELAGANSRHQREVAEQRQAHEARATDARRTQADRVAAASRILSSEDTATPLERYCAAERELGPLPPGAARMSAFRPVFRAFRLAHRAALEDAREAARPGRMILCCDGMPSPSCECGRRNRSGCCSWHGGICGCEPLPDEVFCAIPR